MMRIFLLTLLAIAAGLLWLPTARAAERPPANPTPDPNPADDIRAFHLLSPDEGWVLADNDLLWTGNGGDSWREITPPGTGSVLAVEFLNRLDGWVALVEPEEAWAPDYTLATTSDGGVTWDTLSLTLFDEGDVAGIPAAVSLDRLDPARAWLMVKRASGSNFDQGTLFQTGDGGETWTRLPAPGGNPTSFVNDREGWLVGGPERNALYRTRDGGRSWQRQEIIPPGQDADLRYRFMLPVFERDGRGALPVLAIGEDFTLLDIYITADGGDAWERASRIKVSDAATEEIPLAMLGPEGWLVSTPKGGMIATADGGASYVERRAQGLSGQIVELQMADGRYGWALQVSGTCNRDPRTRLKRCSQTAGLIQTEDGGRTWGALNLPAPEDRRMNSGSGGVPLDVHLRGRSALPGPQKSYSLEIITVPEETTILQTHGFDKCEVPTQSQLSNWYENSPYEAVNLYIGGSCRTCSNTALTAEYVAQLEAQGWKFIPTWVGPQTQCWGGGCSNINNDLVTAYEQGVSDADAAIAVAIDLGLAEPDGSGTVIYYDLEAYSSSSACREAAKSFISGWSFRLREYGSQAGVYGSACTSYIPDFSTITHVPDVVWLAHWIYDAYNEAATVWDVACISDDLWANRQRLRQYTGGHNETWGTVTLNIDSNVLDGVVAGCAPSEFTAAPTISSDGSSVSLAWEAVTGAVEYNIYRGESPYFAPTTPYATTSQTTWTDPDANAIGDPAANHYYVVRAVDACGESGIIHRLGTFDFSLTPGDQQQQ